MDVVRFHWILDIMIIELIGLTDGLNIMERKEFRMTLRSME